MTVVTFFWSVSDTNDRLVEVAADLATSRCDDLLLIGVADIPPWIRILASIGGVGAAVDTSSRTLLKQVESELRRCIALVPDGVAARYACFTAWNASSLSGLLRLHRRAMLVAMLAPTSSRDRRKLHAIARDAEGTLVMVQSHLAPDGGEPSDAAHPVYQ